MLTFLDVVILGVAGMVAHCDDFWRGVVREEVEEKLLGMPPLRLLCWRSDVDEFMFGI